MYIHSDIWENDGFQMKVNSFNIYEVRILCYETKDYYLPFNLPLVGGISVTRLIGLVQSNALLLKLCSSSSLNYGISEEKHILSTRENHSWGSPIWLFKISKS